MERGAVNKLCGVQRMAWLYDLDLAFEINEQGSKNMGREK